jgi:hypothetical protein
LQYLERDRVGDNVYPIYTQGEGSATTPPGASTGPCINLLGRLKALQVAAFRNFNSLFPNIAHIVGIHPQKNEGRSLKELINALPP